MKKILYISDNETEQDIYLLNLESKIDAEITHRIVNSEKDLNELDDDSDYFIINIELESLLHKLIDGFIDGNHPKRPTAVLRENIDNNLMLKVAKRDSMYLFREFSSSQELTQMIAEKFNLEIKEDDFSPIKLYQFLYFNSVPCDIYLQLSSKKYIKLINKDEMYAKDIIEKYQEKKLTHLYIKKEDFKVFIEDVAQTLLLAYKSKNSNFGLRSKIDLASQEMVNKLITCVGVTESTIELAKNSIDSTLQILEKDPNILKLVNDIKNKGTYLSEHGLMISYIACGISANIDWNSRGTHLKLCMAAMLHDASIHSESFLDAKEVTTDFVKTLSRKEKNEYYNHPVESAKIVEKLTNPLPNVDNIIREHHEKVDGTGFPRGLGHIQITPLSCIFILAEDFVNQLYLNGFTQDNRDSIIENFSSKYAKGNFRVPLKGIISLFI